jgi:hypothetical protein
MFSKDLQITDRRQSFEFSLHNAMSVMCQVHRIERIMWRDEHTPDAAETTLSNIKLEL